MHTKYRLDIYSSRLFSLLPFKNKNKSTHFTSAAPFESPPFIESTWTLPFLRSKVLPLCLPSEGNTQNQPFLMCFSDWRFKELSIFPNFPVHFLEWLWGLYCWSRALRGSSLFVTSHLQCCLFVSVPGLASDAVPSQLYFLPVLLSANSLPNEGAFLFRTLCTSQNLLHS